MAQFGVDELNKIAEISSLHFSDQELEAFARQIATLLDYIEELKNVSVTLGIDTVRNINVFRDDKTVISNSSPILDQAPQTDNTYFVVPKILD